MAATIEEELAAFEAGGSSIEAELAAFESGIAQPAFAPPSADLSDFEQFRAPFRQEPLPDLMGPDVRRQEPLPRREQPPPQGQVDLADFPNRQTPINRAILLEPPPDIRDRIAAATAELSARSEDFFPRLGEAGKLKLVNARRAKFGLGPVEKIEGKAGVADWLRDDFQITQMVPFANIVPLIEELVAVAEATDRIVTDQATIQDWRIFAAAQEKLARESRGKTIPATAAGIVPGIVALGGEFLASGGLLTLLRKGGEKLGEKAAVKTVARAIGKAAKTKLAQKAGKLGTVRAGKAVVRLGAETVARMPTFSHRIVADVLSRTNPKYVPVPGDKEHIDLILADPGQDFIPALRDATLGVGIMVFSELTGRVVAPAGRAISQALRPVTRHIRLPIEKIPILKASIIGQLMKGKKWGLKRATDFLAKSGWHGTITEIGEERLEEILRAVADLQPYRFPGAEQLAAEGLAFSIPGLGAAGYAVAAQHRPPAQASDILRQRLAETAPQPSEAAQPSAPTQGPILGAQAASAPATPLIRPAVSAAELAQPEQAAEFVAREPEKATELAQAGRPLSRGRFSSLTGIDRQRVGKTQDRVRAAQAVRTALQAQEATRGETQEPAAQVEPTQEVAEPRAAEAKAAAVEAETRAPFSARQVLPREPGLSGFTRQLEGMTNKELVAFGRDNLNLRLGGKKKAAMISAIKEAHNAQEAARQTEAPGPQARLEGTAEESLRVRNVAEGREGEEAQEEIVPDLYAMTRAQLAEHGGREFGLKLKGKKKAEMVQAIKDARIIRGFEADILPAVARIPAEQQEAIVRREKETPEQAADLREAIKAPNEEIRRRVGIARKGIQKISEIPGTIVQGWRQLTRAQEFLPNNKKFAVANEAFRLIKALRESSPDKAFRFIAHIVGDMTDAELEVFTTKLALDNQRVAKARGEPWRFGIETATEQEIDDWQDKINAAAQANPQIRAALGRRAERVEKIVREAVNRRLLPPSVLENMQDYYHQQVLLYQQADVFLRGRGAGVRPVKGSAQKHRVRGVEVMGEEFDYNLNYLEAESEWMTHLLIEIGKSQIWDVLTHRYDMMPELEAEAKRQREETGDPTISGVELARRDPGLDTYQLQPGHVLYPAVSLVDQVVAEVRAQGTAQISEEDLRKVRAIGGEMPTVAMPKELVAQLNLVKNVSSSKVAALAAMSIKTWKQWILMKPDTALSYNLRNLTGDGVPIVVAQAYVLDEVPETLGELQEFHFGSGKPLTKMMRNSRDLGVVSSAMTEVEVASAVENKALGKLLRSRSSVVKAPAHIVGRYFEVVRERTIWRENILRHASFRGYLKSIETGTLRHYGGSRKSVVDALIKEWGNEVAAAHLARNLLGDYGNLTVFGEWMRRHVYPFWSWKEINLKRWPRMAINSIEYARLAGDTTSGKAIYAALASAALIGPYVAMQLYNNLVWPDKERDLGPWDRANPHLLFCRNADGSVRIFRNIGALGDFLELFGVNSLINLLPLYENGQITVAGIAKEMLKDPVNMIVSGLRPDIKAMLELAFGISTFPDVFSPRSQRRREAIPRAIGMVDEWQALEGFLTRQGVRARPHYLQRYLLGVVDPKASAIHEMHDLRNRFLAKKGKARTGWYGVSAATNMRRAAINNDYEAFKEARRTYIKKGNLFRKNFKPFLRGLDPIASRLNAKDEREFEQEFLTAAQRQRLRIARGYAQELKALMTDWWIRTQKEDKLSR